MSNINDSLGLEWTAKALKEQGLSTYWILLNDNKSGLGEQLIALDIPVITFPYSGKLSALSTILKLIRVFIVLKPNTVHTHLFDASLCGQIAAWLCRIPNRIVTRHHSTFHHLYFPRAVYYDRFITFLSTRVIAVSENVKRTLLDKEGTASEKVTVCTHGFDFNYFMISDIHRVEDLKAKYQLQSYHPVIGVISRYEQLKGIQYIIPAFKELLNNYPHSKLILANASGRFKKEIEKLLHSLPEKSYIEIPFEYDLKSLYSCMDIYVHCPINEDIEAFGQTYVEALIMKIPSIFTLSGIAKEFIRHEHNALVVPFQNSDAIYQSMLRILQEKNLSAHLTKNGFQDVKQRFDLEQMINCLVECYRK